MKYSLNMKTGFFTSKPYSMTVSKGLVALFPDSSPEDCIRIPEESISGIVIRKKHRMEMELSTKEKVFSGTFNASYDPKELFDLFIDNIKTTTTYKEE